MSYYTPYAPAARLKLTVASPPQTFVEPLDIGDMIRWCNVHPSDADQIENIVNAIASARSEAEIRQGRDLVAKQWDLTLDGFPDQIKLRDNASSIDLMQYRDSDGVWTPTTAYILDTALNIVIPPYSATWPSFTPYPSSAVLVRYTVTPPAVDPIVLQGMRCLVIMAIDGDARPDKLAAARLNLEFGKVERL